MSKTPAWHSPVGQHELETTSFSSLRQPVYTALWKRPAPRCLFFVTHIVPVAMDDDCLDVGGCLLHAYRVAAEDAAEVEGAKNGRRHGRWQGPQEGELTNDGMSNLVRTVPSLRTVPDGVIYGRLAICRPRRWVSILNHTCCQGVKRD